MASAFANLFKSKKKGSKDINEPAANIHRGKATSSSMRHARPSESGPNSRNRPSSGGVYVGSSDFNLSPTQEEGSSFEEQQQHSHYQQRNKPSSVIGVPSSSWSRKQWFRSPYEVVTEPKTKKSSRSCPGAPSYQPPPASVASLRHSRHHSPPSRYAHHQQQHCPTIHEVSGCYENYPTPSGSEQQLNGINSIGQDVGSMQRQRREKTPAHMRSSMSHASRTSGGSASRSHAGSVMGIESGSYNPLRQRIFGGGYSNNTNIISSSNKYHGHHPTSEYGSADPSPTNQYPPIPSVSSTSDVHHIGNGEDFENTDYDSDSDAMPTDLVQLCTQQLRLVNGKCKAYKETARRYKSKNMRLLAELQLASDQLAKEKGKNHNLSLSLMSAKEEVHRLHSCLMQFSENVPPHQPPSRTQHHQHKLVPLQPALDSSNFLTGAGEALCSRTDSNSDLLVPIHARHHNDQSGARHHNDHKEAIHSLFSPKFNHHHQEEDEVITFRRDKFLESPFNDDFEFGTSTEQARHSTSSDHLNSSACLSPPGHSSKNKCMDDVAEDSSGRAASNIKEDDGYATMLQQQQQQTMVRRRENENKESAETCNNTTTSISNSHSQSSANGLTQNEVEEDIFQSTDSIPNGPLKKGAQEIKCPALGYCSPKHIQNPAVARRSYSDSDVSRICMDMQKEHQVLRPMEEFEGEGLGYQEDHELVWDDEEGEDNEDAAGTSRLVKIAKQRPHRYPKPTAVVGVEEDNKSGLKGVRRSKYCCYSPKRGDYSSSYSSDDDAIRVLAKQLRKRGEVVHFRPPRKSLVAGNCQEKLFRHFGQQERNAIAQFEYLKDIPTDVSGLLSSPDPQSPT